MVVKLLYGTGYGEVHEMELYVGLKLYGEFDPWKQMYDSRFVRSFSESITSKQSYIVLYM